MITLFRSLFAPPRHLILLVAALWLGLALSEKHAERYRISNETLNNVIYFSLVGYIVGGRVFFVLANLSAFTQSLPNIFSINIDLFDPVGAAVTALLVGFMYGQRQKLALWSTLDALTPFFAALAVGLPLAHLAAGTAFGKPTSLPWAMNLWNATRHPTQVYELIGSLITLIIIWWRKAASPSGSSFLLFAALMAGSRLFLEAFRGDSMLIFGGIRLAQLIAWLVLAVALLTNEFLQKETQTD